MQDKEIKTIKALVIDDSAFNRQTIKRILEKNSNIQVVGVASDGHDGIVKVLRLNPDVITLDLEMPKMDGFTFLRWMMKEKPTPVIIVSSYGDSQTVFNALDLGAVDFVVKPTRRVSRDLEEIETDLLRKIGSVTSLKIEKLQQNLSLLSHRKAITEVTIKETSGIKMIAIGASTGGPAAIQSILTRFPADFPSAVVISQHMPRGFTRQFAERIDELSMIKVKEAEDGEVVEESKAFICPGGFHMTFKHSDNKILTVLKESSHNDKYVPSINLMMKSAAMVCDSRMIGVILTGMGNDGKEGMLEIRNKGGYTIAESEDSSVIFGMPQEAILAGAATSVLPLKEIPENILERLKIGG